MKLLYWLETPWLEAVLTTVIPCLEVSLLLIFAGSSGDQNFLAGIVANTTKYPHITPVRKSFHWLPIKHCSVFKMALLVYKFLHSGYPKHFEPFLKPKHI